MRKKYNYETLKTEKMILKMYHEINNINFIYLTTSQTCVSKVNKCFLPS